MVKPAFNYHRSHDSDLIPTFPTFPTMTWRELSVFCQVLAAQDKAASKPIKRFRHIKDLPCWPLNLHGCTDFKASLDLSSLTDGLEEVLFVVFENVQKSFHEAANKIHVE